MYRILITAGATREPVDSVRFISNLSTGSTGAALADLLSAQGHRVLLLRGEGSVEPRRRMKQAVFGSAADLEQRLRQHLSGDAFNAVIMCAAVADYRPARPISGKLRSDARSLTLRLVRNQKILPKLKSFSPSPLAVIGFKLTVGASATERQEAVDAQLASGTVDAVIQNDLEEIRSSRVHPFWLYLPAQSQAVRIGGTARLARKLPSLIGRLLESIKHETSRRQHR